eukprot:3558582-Amphidinium_carterae.1
MSTDKQRLEQDTLSEAWGRPIQVSPLPSSMPEVPLASTNASQTTLLEAASPPPSSSDSSSDSSSSDAEDASNQDGHVTVEWLLPKGPRSLLHVRRPSREDGQAFCQRAPFVWGFESGRGMDDPNATGRRWCT